MPCIPLFRRGETLIHEGLPPSFLPSMVIPSVTANASSTIPSVGDVSMADLTHASQATKGYLINASQDVERAFSHASPSWFRNMAPVRITCRDWTYGEIFDWYRRQPYTTVSKLELRKERDHFKHEFIVIYLDNGWCHRIDRRPVKGANVEAISKEGCEAEDSLTPVTDANLAVIRSEADAEITLEFKSNKPDLYNVIAVAVAIHLDPQTRNYTLQQYNCYFVARSIIALVTRYCLLLRTPIMTGLRWDSVTESAISHYIFGGNWNKLTNAMKASTSAVLNNLLWDVIKADAGTRIEKKKDWGRLRDIVKRVIHEDVERSSATLASDVVQRAVNEWIIHATQATLWRDNIDQTLSERQYAKKLEMTIEGALKMALQPELEVHLPGDILKGLSEVLPERLINRIPPSVLARLPPEMLARASVRVLEKLPDDFIAKLPYDVLRHAPSELWQKISVDRYSKLRDAILLTLPDDLGVVPRELLEVSLQRMQDVLDQPEDCPDRILALKLLRHLPQEQLAQLPSSYIAMCNLEVDGELDFSDDRHTGEEETSAERKPRRLLRGLKTKWDEVSFFGLVILLAPKPILKLVPSYAVDFMPDWSLGSLPTSALERLPNELIVKLQIRHLERFPTRLLEKLPESLLRRMPRSTLERLPIPLLERLPTELLRKFPPELIENIPEGLTDQIGEVIQSRAFESEDLKQKLSERVRELVRVTLVTASSELSAAVIQVSVLTNARKRVGKKLSKHEDLQEHILHMNRVHSKMVAQVPLLGMGEEKVYSGLRAKMEDIWQVMRLHTSRQGHSFGQNS